MDHSISVPAFKVGNVGEENKWVTLYACMARKQGFLSCHIDWTE